MSARRRRIARHAFGGLLLLGLVALGANGCRSERPRIVVAAASDLTNALGELAAAFELQTGIAVAPTFGASKQLATQIEQGAPFDVFLSANVAFVDGVIKSGRCDEATRALYGRGHLVLWTKPGRRAPKSLGELADPAFVKVAIANPETAPYGMAARRALEASRLWSEVEARIVRGDTVRQALQLAESGNADVAIVARSLAIGSNGTYTAVDESLYPPIEQALVVCAGGKDAVPREAARAFATFVTSPEGQGILSRWGLGR